VIHIPAEAKFDPGSWNLAIDVKESSEVVDVAIDFEADGHLTVTKPSALTGTWTYVHRKLRFDLTNGSETLEFEAAGPPKGPLTGGGVLESKAVTYRLEREP